MLKENVEYQVTVTFRDPSGISDETDPEMIITKAFEEFDLDVVDVSYPVEVNATTADVHRLTR